MTDEQKAALAWLESLHGPEGTINAEHKRVLFGLVAEPPLPKEASEEQKAALAWLDNAISRDAKWESVGDEMDRAIIKAMLAEPRLPKEPSIELLDAMEAANYAPVSTTTMTFGRDRARQIYRALYAHLTKPATKTVEVWHVEYTHYTNPNLVIRGTAEAAEKSRQEIIADGCKCVRVTGPHQHEVPA